MAGALAAVDEASNNMDTATLIGAFQHVGEIVRDILKQQEQRAELLEQLHSQEQKTERRIQDALRIRKEEAQKEIQEIVQQHEQKEREMRAVLREMQVKLEDATRAQAEGAGRMEERMRRAEERLQAMERKLKLVVRPERAEDAGGLVVLGLEERMENLEASVQRALDCVFPRVDALVSQLEERRPPEPLTALPTSSASDTTSSSSTSSCSPAATVSSQNTPSGTSVPILTNQERLCLSRSLMDAVEAGRAEDVKRLVDAGADINVRWLGLTPLMKAANVLDLSVVSLLLNMGADVNARNEDGVTALHLSASKDSSGNCVRLLINSGADVACTDEWGNTPLHTVGSCEAAALLVTAGASRTVVNNDGKTPLDCFRSVFIGSFLGR